MQFNESENCILDASKVSAIKFQSNYNKTMHKNHRSKLDSLERNCSERNWIVTNLWWKEASFVRDKLCSCCYEWLKLIQNGQKCRVQRCRKKMITIWGRPHQSVEAQASLKWNSNVTFGSIGNCMHERPNICVLQKHRGFAVKQCNRRAFRL